MRVGIMQPYLFPYVGYFQLLDAVDKFVVLDDVNFIKKGWINRNRVLCRGKAFTVTMPVKKISQNKKICDHEMHEDFVLWRRKFKKQLKYSYGKAPNYKRVYDLIEEILDFESVTIDTFLLNSIKKLCAYLKIQTQFIDSARFYNNQALKGQDRIIDICLKEKASMYINPIGGMKLYEKNIFEKYGMELRFIQTENLKYFQFSDDFVPWLSIIDLIMFNSISDVDKIIANYNLVKR